jgi:hypothetical protein
MSADVIVDNYFVFILSLLLVTGFLIVLFLIFIFYSEKKAVMIFILQCMLVDVGSIIVLK